MIAASWSAGTAPALLRLPAGAVDSHHHIYDACFPADPRADLRPADATVAQYRLLQARLGTSRSVVVQPSTYGTDNSCLLAALKALGSAARGIAVVDQDVDDAELQSLHAAGVRGIRFNFARPAGPNAQRMEALAHRIAPLGWHVQVHALADSYLSLEHVLQRLPTPLVIDHLGRFPQPQGLSHPAWPVLRKLVERGNTWVKLSGAYHDSKCDPAVYTDAGVVTRAWLNLAPERMVWGSDWPHTSAMAGEKPMPDDASMLDLFGEWAGSQGLQRQVLVDNPVQLYGFESLAPDAGTTSK